MVSRFVEAVDFPAPYDDPRTFQKIVQNCVDVMDPESPVPATQVTIGEDLHLAGSMVVQRAAELAVSTVIGAHLKEHGKPPFRFISQNRDPDFRCYKTAIAPHLDVGQIGLAIHTQDRLGGAPFEAQFGYAKLGAEFPETLAISESTPYDGLDLTGYVRDIYTAQITSGTVTIFSQGYPSMDIAPTAHFFPRPFEQAPQVGGNHYRSFMVSPEAIDFTRTPAGFDALVKMRQQAMYERDLRRLKRLEDELNQSQHLMNPEEVAAGRAMIKAHRQDHPGEGYAHWSIAGSKVPGEVHYSYGVHGKNAYYPEQISEFFLYKKAATR